MSTIATVILAAGSSSRMGQSKQLLPWQNDTLLRHAVATALAAQLGPVHVILGSKSVEHLAVLENLPVSTHVNPHWEAGMGSSLKFGLKNINTASDGLIVMVCDQPFVTAEHLRNLVSDYRAKSVDIVASEYGGTKGVPAFFAPKMFGELASISDREGARSIIAKQSDRISSIHLEKGEEDIDTYEQYLRLVGQRRR